MKRDIIRGALFGFPIGIAIGYLSSIFYSLIWADGAYLPCTPELISVMGNEIKAVMLQTLLCGLVGAGFSASSVIWNIGNWSIAKQTVIYFIITSVIMMPSAYITYWMEHSIKGFLSYFALFLLIFALIWIIEYMIIRHNIKKMNDNLYKAQE